MADVSSLQHAFLGIHLVTIFYPLLVCTRKEIDDAAKVYVENNLAAGYIVLATCASAAELIMPISCHLLQSIFSLMFLGISRTLQVISASVIDTSRSTNLQANDATWRRMFPQSS